MEEGPGKIGAVEHRLEQIRSLQACAGETRLGEGGAPQAAARKIEPVQIEAPQGGPRQAFLPAAPRREAPTRNAPPRRAPPSSA